MNLLRRRSIVPDRRKGGVQCPPGATIGLGRSAAAQKKHAVLSQAAP